MTRVPLCRVKRALALCALLAPGASALSLSNGASRDAETQTQHDSASLSIAATADAAVAAEFPDDPGATQEQAMAYALGVDDKPFGAKGGPNKLKIF